MNKTTYRGFTVGDLVTVKNPVECQYYNYPNRGDHPEVLIPGQVARIRDISVKVRVSVKDSGDLFFNLEHGGVIYSCCDYRDLVRVKPIKQAGQGMVEYALIIALLILILIIVIIAFGGAVGELVNKAVTVFP